MKVIILGPSWPYRGGIAASSERLACQYLAEGHEVEMVTFTLQYPSFLFPGKTQYSNEPIPKWLKTKRMLNSINPFSWIRTGLYIKHRKPDLLITTFWLPFMAPALGTADRFAKRKGMKRVAVLHNLIPHEHRPGDKLFSRYFVKSNDCFITLSRSVLEDLNDLDPNKSKSSTYTPHPLYDHYGEKLQRSEALGLLGLRESQRYVLFFGFIRDYKGLDILLKAMADERMVQLGVKLIVAGEFYGDPKPYNDLLRELDISDRVVMHTDFIPDNEVNRYFCSADLVVQPYKTATQSGVSQIAYHFEKPMVVTNVGGLPEIVPDGKCGFVVEPNAQAVADAIVRYFEENWEERMAECVREEKQKYQWSNMTKAIEELKYDH
ncbi:MAG: glycosyltransferase [Bacteroidales bacterium]|nr:glycosyltransferase [Bacteroidales bacterium]